MHTPMRCDSGPRFATTLTAASLLRLFVGIPPRVGGSTEAWWDLASTEANFRTSGFRRKTDQRPSPPERCLTETKVESEGTSRERLQGYGSNRGFFTKLSSFKKSQCGALWKSFPTVVAVPPNLPVVSRGAVCCDCNPSSSIAWKHCNSGVLE